MLPDEFVDSELLEALETLWRVLSSDNNWVRKRGRAFLSTMFPGAAPISMPSDRDDVSEVVHRSVRFDPCIGRG